jgi:hypothetical protein
MTRRKDFAGRPGVGLPKPSEESEILEDFREGDINYTSSIAVVAA